MRRRFGITRSAKVRCTRVRARVIVAKRPKGIARDFGFQQMGRFAE